MLKGTRVKNRSDHAAASPQVFVNKNHAQGDAAPAAPAAKKTRKARKPRKDVVDDVATDEIVDIVEE
jgi:hypothetical protein